ncbi:MAG: hypothetical protein MEQ07_05205 [Aquimonas sp.]|nr:hypothetical protein [Aquimonas sp.]
MRRFHLSLLPGLLLGLVSAPAFATGGFYEINDACKAIGCFPGDNPATPTIEITNETVNSGIASFRLSGSLTNTVGNTASILVETNQEVSIDLQGHQILCTLETPCQSGNSAGVQINGFGKVRIHNGSISNFRDGIRADNNSFLIAEHLTISGATDDGIQMGRGVVRNSQFVNTRYGIFATTRSILIEGNSFHDTRPTPTQQPLIGAQIANSGCSGNVIAAGNSILNLSNCIELGPNLCGSQRCGFGGLQAFDPSVSGSNDK